MSFPVWLSQALYNRWRGSYFSGDVDTEGNVVIRGTSSLWLDTTTSIKLNGGSVVTLSRDELSYLDGVTSSIQTQLNGKATTGDVSTLQTKTQNITATSVLTTIDDNVTLSTGNLVLTNGDLTVASTKSIICDGEFKLGSTGRISGTGLAISNAQLIYLNGLTANIESRLASVVTKTQLLSSSASLATFSNAVTLTTGNLTLTLGNLTLSNGDLSVISGKSILNNGTLNFGTTGTIRVNNTDITNQQLQYLTNLTASVETRLASCVQKLTPITFNSTGNTSDFTSDIYLNGNGATQTRKIVSDGNTIEFDDQYGFINFLNKIHMYSEFQLDYGGTTYYVGSSLADLYSKNDTINNTRITGITYNSTTGETEIDHNLTITGSTSGVNSNFFFCKNTSGTSVIALASNATLGTSNFIITSTQTAGAYSTKQIAGDACVLASKPIVFCINSGSTQATALRLTESQLQLNCDILTNGLTISPTEIGYLDGITENLNTSITNLNTKTANMTSIGAVTSYTGTHTFGAIVNISNTQRLSINGTGKILLNGTTSYIEMGTSLGILTTGTIYINATELSMLDGATYNLPTRTTTNTNDIATINTTLTNYSYSSIPTPQTTIAGVVNFTGTTKTTGVTWADGPIKLKSSWVAPVSGELGYNLSATISGGVQSVTTNVVKNLLSVTLPIGVYVITYNCYVVYGSGTSTTSLRIGLNTTSGSTQATVAVSTEQVTSYIGTKSYSSTYIANVSVSTTYYLTLYSLFSGGILSVDGGNANTTDLRAIKIA